MYYGLLYKGAVLYETKVLQNTRLKRVKSPQLLKKTSYSSDKRKSDQEGEIGR
jgi:hypothetical protein